MKMGVFLLFGRTKRPDLHRNSPPAFFAAYRWQLGARCSLDRLNDIKKLSDEISMILFWGQHLERQNEQPKADCPGRPDTTSHGSK
jgi:hypothetical protein